MSLEIINLNHAQLAASNSSTSRHPQISRGIFTRHGPTNAAGEEHGRVDLHGRFAAAVTTAAPTVATTTAVTTG